MGQAYVYANGPLGQYNLLGEYGNGGFATDSTPGQAEYLWLPTEQGAQLVGIYKDAQLLSVHTDHLGTPRLVKDRQNAPVWQWAYSAFGDNLPLGAYTKMMYTPAAGAAPVTRYRSQPAQMTMNLRFPGQYFDSESNLSYNYFRSYQPGQGRYTQADPIGLVGGWSRFAYVGGDPLGSSDPRGLASEKIDGSRITVHKNDVDPWPSDPHGHVYDKNQVIDKDGTIYDKTTGKAVGKLSKKGLAKWLDFLKRIGKLGLIGDLLFFKDWVEQTCRVAMPDNPFCNEPPPPCYD